MGLFNSFQKFFMLKIVRADFMAFNAIVPTQLCRLEFPLEAVIMPHYNLNTLGRQIHC